MKINTDAVSGLAQRISNDNQEMQTAFEAAIASANALGNGWSGAAYNHASASFGTMKEKYYNARYTGIENYVRILRKQIGEGYEKTEQSNISLAEQFK